LVVKLVDNLIRLVVPPDVMSLQIMMYWKKLNEKIYFTDLFSSSYSS